MSNNFSLRVGESLVAGGPPGTAAEPEVIIGDLNSAFGTAFATLLGNQIKGHTKVLAIMNTDIIVCSIYIFFNSIFKSNWLFFNFLCHKVFIVTFVILLFI